MLMVNNINEALNAVARPISILLKKNTAALSRIPMSPKEIGKQVLTNIAEDDAAKASTGATGSKAETNKNN